MSPHAKDCKSTVIPAMRYRDAHKAIGWLVTAFGMEKKAVYDAPEGHVAHAELTFGNGMIMIGSVANGGEYSKLISQPDEIDGRSTQSICLIVTDATALYNSAKAAGAEITGELAEMEYGGKAFGCKDPEGHLWSIGEYDPWSY
jgi:uncharacterized glyoxalase superfamily protein PhnB